MARVLVDEMVIEPAAFAARNFIVLEGAVLRIMGGFVATAAYSCSGDLFEVMSHPSVLDALALDGASVGLVGHCNLYLDFLVVQILEVTAWNKVIFPFFLPDQYAQ